ncbi:hypothetical protein GCM10023172_24720 [Hymenobacter ginsengisoli]|uniref:Yip1 domain-containing protein n=1 Tax=Hymenobacter ginsengisoli TaxID=1051626 RepID=A0ABP8QJA3_9BACT|nr:MULTISPECIES: YIP1 family protein [unclassified Hymenobacter]MBO2030269.1 YIP1 family protein [Hymenobacter sp. BT559]
MHEVLPYSPPDNDGVNKTNLLRKIWSKPRATLAYVLDKHIDEHVSLFFVLGGIARAVARVTAQYSSQPTHKMGLSTSLILAIIGGSISGIVTYIGYSWGLSLIGGWLGGRATNDQFKIVLGWALVPSITTLVFLFPALCVLNGEFTSTPLLADTLLASCGLAQIGLGIWSSVILIKGVILIQNFSIGRAMANVLLPGAVLIGLILLIASFW